MRRTGGQVLVAALRINGCRQIFGVPGESYLSALDALHDTGNQIRYVTCRQEDVLRAETSYADLPRARATPVAPSAADMESVRDLLSTAKRPLLLLGGSTWTRDGNEAIKSVAAMLDLPVAVAFRRQGLFPNNHANYVGNLGFGGAPVPNDYARATDLLIVVGARLDDGTTLKFSLIAAPTPPCTLVHVHPGPEELGRLYQADLPIQADPNAFATALTNLVLPAPPSWSAIRRQLRAEFETMVDLPPQPG